MRDSPIIEKGLQLWLKLPSWFYESLRSQWVLRRCDVFPPRSRYHIQDRPFLLPKKQEEGHHQ